MENPKLAELSHKALLLPEKPGVYIMKDASGHIIYIGKAKVLKNRVSQYFRAGARHEPKVQKMVETAREFDYIVCGSEFEALVLECSLIKQYNPKYNILLKDDKGFHLSAGHAAALFPHQRGQANRRRRSEIHRPL